MNLMNRRIDLHHELKKLMYDLKYDGARVFYNPLPNTQLLYPCIIYHMNTIQDRYAGDKRYFYSTMYDVQVIDKDPDSKIVSTILERFQYCKLNNDMITDGLYHFNLTIYNGGNIKNET